MKGFFKSLWSVIKKVLPFLGKALDDKFIRLILISKLGQKAVDIIIKIVKGLDEIADMTNEEKHAEAEHRIASQFAMEGLQMPSRSETGIHISMAVKELRGKGSIQVPRGL